MSDWKQKKIELRKHMKQQLAQMTEFQRIEESREICDRLRLMVKQLQQERLVIASFAGLYYEPDLLSLHQALPEHVFVYPRCGLVGEMIFYRVNNPTKSLKKGSYGIREPVGNPVDLYQHEAIDVFLVPAFAYTDNGIRLGKGGGYYDRVLASIYEALVVGVGFSTQRVDSIPDEPHDVRVDQVIIPEMQ